MFALPTFLIPSITQDILWKKWQTITPKKDGKNIDVYHFARGLDAMQCELIPKQGRKLIADEVKIRKFLHYISDIIYKSITAHLPDDIRWNIVGIECE